MSFSKEEPDMFTSESSGNREDQSRKSSVDSIASISSVMLGTATTANCEIGVLPLKLLLELQSQYLRQEGSALTSTNQHGGFNLFSDGTSRVDGEQCQIINYIERKVELKSHFDYKDYRETVLSKPMLFLVNAKKINNQSTSEKTFAVIVNTRHPKIRAQVEGGMNDVISSVMGENYRLQFEFQDVVKEFLLMEGFEMVEDTLGFSYTFKVDVLIDIFHLLGLSKKKCQVTGRIQNLYCTKPSKKDKVKMFLSRMTNPLIRLGSSSEHRPSIFALDVIEEDPSVQNADHYVEDSPKSPLTL
ncbi:mesenteric estrogen-dependent adipogenesis protein [Rhinophrynus dorsalis]